MKTFTKTIAAVIALSFVAVNSASARVKDDDKELLQIPGYTTEAEETTGTSINRDDAILIDGLTSEVDEFDLPNTFDR